MVAPPKMEKTRKKASYLTRGGPGRFGVLQKVVRMILFNALSGNGKRGGGTGRDATRGKAKIETRRERHLDSAKRGGKIGQ